MTRKRVTMKDIADRLNLSINAVSLALNDKTGVGEETKRLILNTAEEMGYLDQSVKYSLQGTTQGRYLTGGVPPVRFSM